MILHNLLFFHGYTILYLTDIKLQNGGNPAADLLIEDSSQPQADPQKRFAKASLFLLVRKGEKFIPSNPVFIGCTEGSPP